MPQEILNAVKLIHNDTGEQWLFFYDSTPDVIQAIHNEASDPASAMTFQDADNLIKAAEFLEDNFPLNQDQEEDMQEFI